MDVSPRRSQKRSHYISSGSFKRESDGLARASATFFPCCEPRALFEGVAGLHALGVKEADKWAQGTG